MQDLYNRFESLFPIKGNSFEENMNLQLPFHFTVELCF